MTLLCLRQNWTLWIKQRQSVKYIWVRISQISTPSFDIQHYMKRPQHQVKCCCTVISTIYPKKYAHGFCFAVLCCGYTLTDFPISSRLTSLALWQSNDCPSASKATLMNMDKYFMWIHYELLHNHKKAKHNKTVRIFLGIYCTACDMLIHTIHQPRSCQHRDCCWPGGYFCREICNHHDDIECSRHINT